MNLVDDLNVLLADLAVFYRKLQNSIKWEDKIGNTGKQLEESHLLNHRGSLWKLYGFGGKGTITVLSGMIGKSKGKNRVKKEAANMEFGCSSFSWETKGGLHLLGRTYDQFGDLKTNQVIQIPQGLSCAPGLRPGNGDLPGRYGYTGMAVLGFGEPVLVDWWDFLW